MPVHVKVLCLVVVAAVLVIAIVREVEAGVVAVLTVTLATLAPAALSVASSRRGDHDGPGGHRDDHDDD